MAGASSGWHKVGGGPLKGQKVFIPAGVAAQLGTTPAGLAAQLDAGQPTALQALLQAPPLCGVAAGLNSTVVQGAVSSGTVVPVPLLVGHTADAAHRHDPQQSLLFHKHPPPGGSLHGIPFAPAPPVCWLTNQPAVAEPPLVVPSVTHTVWDAATQPPVAVTQPLPVASGCIVVEPDGRLWVYEPTKHFGDTCHTFAKGRLEPNLTLQQNARKEVFEELGLEVALTGWLADAAGTTTYTRYYLARRIGGSPDQAQAESANVKLLTPAAAATLLDQPRDQHLLQVLLTARGATPAPAPGAVPPVAAPPTTAAGADLFGEDLVAALATTPPGDSSPLATPPPATAPARWARPAQSQRAPHPPARDPARPWSFLPTPRP